MGRITNWGLYPVVQAQEFFYKNDLNPQALPAPWIARGLGRSYGDASLSPAILHMPDYKRFLAFDAQSGELRMEAGVSFEDILHHFVPRGWFPPVTPGTKFVTMGGAFAADVHGKNHHKDGSFAKHVSEITLQLPDGQVKRCSPEHNTNLFHATAGGMGLTGIIRNLSLRLRPIETAWIRLRARKAARLESVLDMFEEHADVTYSVAWIDCLAQGTSRGRSILLLGEHATRAEMEGHRYASRPFDIPRKRPLGVPFHLPAFTLNNFSIKAFNFLFYHKHLRSDQTFLQDYDSYFYPLDAIHHWNRIYGRRGFTQYQFVVPFESGRAALQTVLDRVAKAGFGSFLAVLKAFGRQDTGMISFPKEGYTLTLDFPVSPKLFQFMNELDRIIMQHGGRLYLAKDTRMSAEMMEAGYPQWEAFKALQRQIDPEGKVRSLQAQRIGL